MAGTLKVDTLQSDSNLALKIATANVAFIDSNGLNVVGGNLTLAGVTLTSGGVLTTPNAVLTTPTISGNTAFDTNTLFVDATNNRVSIGHLNPEELFHAKGTGETYFKVETTGTQAGIKFETTTAGTSEYGILADSSEALRFYDFKNGSEPVRFNRYGIGLGGSTPSSGMGIKFPATQSASTDANTLDDYEEGTFTPIAASSGGSITSYTSRGNYVKVGRQVTVSFSITLVTPGTASGAFTIGGLPFTTANQTERPGLGIVREDALTGNIYNCFLDQNGTGGQFQTLTGGGVPWTTSYNYTTVLTYIAAA